MWGGGGGGGGGGGQRIFFLGGGSLNFLKGKGGMKKTSEGRKGGCQFFHLTY